MISRNREKEKPIKCINLMLDMEKDRDLVSHLERQEDVHEYLKELIRKDSEKPVSVKDTVQAEKDFNATLVLLKQVAAV